MAPTLALLTAMLTLTQFSTTQYAVAALGLVALYATQQILRPLLSLYLYWRQARTIGLPIKVLPVPQGLFSFFAFQLLKKLPLPRLHAILNMGRPDGYGMHAELGDVFVTVNPMGISLVVADPAVVAYVAGHRCEFPKPPNTGAIINIYGRNVINADGDVWRFHRRVTGPVFSERIHRAVWDHARSQTDLMLAAWANASDPSSHAPSTAHAPLTPPASPTLATPPAPAPLFVPELCDQLLRLAMHVITASAYGTPLAWEGPAAVNPPCTVRTALSYRRSLEAVTEHLMAIFLTPRWLLRAAPARSAWGRAWTAYTAFGGYLSGMLEAERAREVRGRGDEPENLLTVLVRAEDEEPKDGSRRMTNAEVMGNAFIYLFAGHETTANTMHYALLALALYPDVQEHVLAEIDEMFAHAASEGRAELSYEADFPRARWLLAVMNETLRVYTPTGITNKWTAAPQPIVFRGNVHTIPAHTRIMVNGTGMHFNPAVWGDDAREWKPARWLVAAEDADLSPSPAASRPCTPAPGTHTSTPGSPTRLAAPLRTLSYMTPPPSPGRPASGPALHTAATALALFTTTAAAGRPALALWRPPRGAFLPFSEGARACSGKKFAAVEFVGVLATLLAARRVQFGEGWSDAQVRRVLGGRKAGALSLQPPVPIPVRFVAR